MTFHIELKNGKWKVNGKELKDLNKTEKDFMNSFFQEVKINGHVLAT